MLIPYEKKKEPRPVTDVSLITKDPQPVTNGDSQITPTACNILRQIDLEISDASLQTGSVISKSALVQFLPLNGCLTCIIFGLIPASEVDITKPSHFKSVALQPKQTCAGVDISGK